MIKQINKLRKMAQEKKAILTFIVNNESDMAIMSPVRDLAKNNIKIMLFHSFYTQYIQATDKSFTRPTVFINFTSGNAIKIEQIVKKSFKSAFFMDGVYVKNALSYTAETFVNDLKVVSLDKFYWYDYDTPSVFTDVLTHTLYLMREASSYEMRFLNEFVHDIGVPLISTKNITLDYRGLQFRDYRLTYANAEINYSYQLIDTFNDMEYEGHSIYLMGANTNVDFFESKPFYFPEFSNQLYLPYSVFINSNPNKLITTKFFSYQVADHKLLDIKDTLFIIPDITCLILQVMRDKMSKQKEIDSSLLDREKFVYKEEPVEPFIVNYSYSDPLSEKLGSIHLDKPKLELPNLFDHQPVNNNITLLDTIMIKLSVVPEFDLEPFLLDNQVSYYEINFLAKASGYFSVTPTKITRFIVLNNFS